IYIDPLDKDKKEYLETQTGVTVTISEYSFGRGMRAIIPSKNILVDNSFNYKINELKTDYTITF
ncbi:MAG: ATPase, partial [Lachnospiraceae bacterium]|nr:ATPase [Lachnospiraceae bacterium]